jgi:phosphoesterase RecJ-like protein
MDLIKQHADIIKKTYDTLIKSKKVSIFVHVHPDFDALGSASAMKSFLISKGIDAKIIGLENVKITSSNEIFMIDNQTIISDEFISNSIGLILDTANEARVLTQKHTLCKSTIRIDHHPFIEKIAKYE